MPDQSTRRGRPKGSGLDDRSRLRAVAQIIEADPSVKPTTAIRSLGVSDPSAIRRLRDKFAEARADLMREVREAATCSSAARPTMPAAVSRAAPLSARSNATRSVPAPAPRPVPSAVSAPTALAVAPAPEGLHRKPSEWLTAWCGLGVQSVSTMIDVQSAAFQHLLAMPHVAIAMRHQVVLNEFLMSLCAANAAKPCTLH